MKFIIIALLLTTVSLAEEGENLAEAKQKISSHIDKKISQLNAHKSCVQAATSHDQLKSCRQSHREEVKSLNQGAQADGKAFREKMKQKRQERKKKE